MVLIQLNTVSARSSQETLMWAEAQTLILGANASISQIVSETDLSDIPGLPDRADFLTRIFFFL